jgi:acetoin utilization deacetylase AcuC-like enzyme
VADQSSKAQRRTGWIAPELCLWHHTQNWAGFFEPDMAVQPGEHFENAETKRRLKNLIDVCGLHDALTDIPPRIAEDADLLSVHSRAHLDHLEAVCTGGGGDMGALTPGGRSAFQIARLGAGAVLSAVDSVIDGVVDNAYVLCRPPGHHAERETAMGFCLLANAAIGIRHAQARGIGRIATVDWDVHHGNGTQSVFFDDPNVLTISLHQENLFPPGSGTIDEKGSGSGLGANLNIPLPPGSGSGAYRHAFETLVMPALEDFGPEMIFLPTGYDASAMDPLGTMMLSSSDYGWMAGQVVAFAEAHCGGRIVATHEGGYSAMHVPFCGLAVVEALSGAESGVTDPYDIHIRGYGGQQLQDHQRHAIEAASQAFRKARAR